MIIPDNYNLAPFDVVSLFSTISRDLIIEAISRKWRSPDGKLNLSKQEFLEEIMTLIDCSYLQFNNKFYQQIMGASIGFCTSPWFADITLKRLELHCLDGQ